MSVLPPRSSLSLTLSSRIVPGGSSNELLSPGAEGGEARQQLVQLQALSAVLRQLLPDLVHLRRHRGRRPQPLHRALQGLQQGIHLVVKLRTDAEAEGKVVRKRRRERKMRTTMKKR